MSRGLSAEAIAAIESSVVRFEYMYEGHFSAGSITLWSGVGPLSWGGKVWEGNGWLQGPSSIAEANQAASGMSVTLAGEVSDIIALALSEARQSATANIRLAILNESGSVIETILFLNGTLDQVTIDEGAERSTVTFNYLPRTVAINRPRELRFTHEDQQLLYKGDKGFEHVSTLASSRFFWGREAPGRSA